MKYNITQTFSATFSPHSFFPIHTMMMMKCNQYFLNTTESGNTSYIQKSCFWFYIILNSYNIVEHIVVKWESGRKKRRKWSWRITMKETKKKKWRQVKIIRITYEQGRERKALPEDHNRAMECNWAHYFDCVL